MVEVLKIYKTALFNKWCMRNSIADLVLLKGIDEILAGLIDADLGGGLIKKRLARSGYGKSGGYRTLLAFKNNDRAIFITGFAKNEKDNITSEEKMVFKKLSKIYLDLDLKELNAMCKAKKFIEVIYEEA